MTAHGSFVTVGDRPAVRFERRLAHPVDVVWRAVTQPDELAHWFPAGVEVDGTRLRFTHADGAAPPADGEILQFEPPHRFAFTWGSERLEIELEPDGDGCRLTFTHVLSTPEQAARDAAGWHVCLDRLADRLAGEAPQAPGGGRPTSEWSARYAEYERRGLPTGAAVPS